MNYTKIYTALINKAQMRNTHAYTERHHIVPRCMGGADNPDNIANLTPEEHYVAHQLLVKIYPQSKGLVWAAARMTHHSSEHRTNNKLYGWLRRQMSQHGKTKIGSQNPSYGKRWFHNPDTGETLKTDTAPTGWLQGRNSSKCAVCGRPTARTRHKYCSKHRQQGRNSTAQSNNKQLAQDLWQEFLNSNYESVTAFAKSTGTSQPRLTQLWNNHIPEYQSKKRHGKSFKEVDTGS